MALALSSITHSEQDLKLSNGLESKPRLPTQSACLAFKLGEHITWGRMLLQHIERLRVASSRGKCGHRMGLGRSYNGGTAGWHCLGDGAFVAHSLLPTTPPRREEEMERGGRQRWKEKTGWWRGYKRGWQTNTTAPLPNSPFSIMSAQTSPTGREVDEDKERLNTMKLQLHKQLFQTKPPLKKLSVQWRDVMRVYEQWPCSILLLGGACIFSQGVLAGVFDGEGVKLLSSHSQQGRTTHWGWRGHSYLVLHAVGKHTHPVT